MLLYNASLNKNELHVNVFVAMTYSLMSVVAITYSLMSVGNCRLFFCKFLELVYRQDDHERRSSTTEGFVDGGCKGNT